MVPKTTFMLFFVPFMPLWFKKQPLCSSLCPLCLYGSKKTFMFFFVFQNQSPYFFKTAITAPLAGRLTTPDSTLLIPFSSILW
jgi:hypothetical protein